MPVVLMYVHESGVDFAGGSSAVLLYLILVCGWTDILPYPYADKLR
jgi:hypothetical protein